MPHNVWGGLSTTKLLKMKTFELKGTLRTALGKKDSAKLRAEEQVPCVIYGEEAPMHIAVSQKAIAKLIYTPEVYIVNIEVDGKVYPSYMQDIQFHAVSDAVTHIDFLRIYDDKPIKLELPVSVVGFAKGIRKGGKLQVEVRRLQVFGKAKDLPNTIDINVEDLDLGQSLRVSDINIEGLTILNNKSIPVVRVAITRAARAAMNQKG